VFSAEATRARAAEAISAQRIGFRHHNIEFGYAYESGAITPDGTPETIPLDPVLLYEPSTRPGHALPHALIESDGAPFPIGRLAGGAHFALIAGEDGQAWVAAARDLAGRFGIVINVVRIGLYSGDFRDVRGAWLRHRGIGPSGAILVRPDHYIAFQSAKMAADPVATLSSALAVVLDREQMA